MEGRAVSGEARREAGVGAYADGIVAAVLAAGWLARRRAGWRENARFTQSVRAQHPHR